MKAVIDKNRNIKFKGTYDECISYMRIHTKWEDLISLNDDGSFGRLSSWVL
jgi:hypothetical protein